MIPPTVLLLINISTFYNKSVFADSGLMSDVVASSYCQSLFINIEDLTLSRFTSKQYPSLGTPVFHPDPVASFQQTQEQSQFEDKAGL